MRLTCPNCDAQYEVPDEVIPVAGRDVQCSNCGQTWFQHHPDHAPADEDETDLGLGDNAPDEDEEVSPPPPPPPPVEEPQRRQLDPAVADILRQEAEAEHAARKARQAQSLETQPDLGLDTAEDHPPHSYDDDDAPAAAQDQRALEAKRRMARMRGEAEPVSEAAANAAALSSRRELLPDIDEINSTLRSDSDRSAGSRDANGSHAPQEVKKRKRGFRRGFSLMILMVSLMALVYVFAPQIAQQVPQADPYLSSYVTWVDGLRTMLDVQLQRLLTWLDTMASQSAS
jgi:predicted Zn finger-like uncharacterized protein